MHRGRPGHRLGLGARLRLLVLGGTAFLGRHVVESARARGHEVTLFNRGRTNPGLFPGVERLTGDRNHDLAALAGRAWDAVVDTSAYVPGHVSRLAQQLAGQGGSYCLVSSVSVYALEQADKSESAPTLPPPEDGSEDVGLHYGALKALCERAARAGFGEDRVLILRSGLIVGPWDPTNRFTYWVSRVAAGGEVLAPGGPEYTTQFIDARDEADWILRSLEDGLSGTFNCTGPSRPLPLGELFAAVQSVAGSRARLTWVPDSFLEQHRVAPWSEMPLWIPAAAGSLTDVPVERALGAGLRFRTLEDTVAATLEWVRAGGAAGTQVDASGRRREPGGIAPERERELLAAWHAGA